MAHLKIFRSGSDIDKAIKKTKKSGIPLVVKFHAPWCEPCNILAPLYESLSILYHGAAKFASMNVDLDDDAAQNHGIKIIPAIHVWSNGSLMATHVRKSEIMLCDHMESVENTIRVCIARRSLSKSVSLGYLGGDEGSDSPDMHKPKLPLTIDINVPNLPMLKPERSPADAALPRSPSNVLTDFSVAKRQKTQEVAELVTIFH